ncbi:MAG: hypothetical protein AB9M53_10465 [Leptothrix sp. (in: b-proteobacteria)]
MTIPLVQGVICQPLGWTARKTAHRLAWTLQPAVFRECIHEQEAICHHIWLQLGPALLFVELGCYQTRCFVEQIPMLWALIYSTTTSRGTTLRSRKLILNNFIIPH